MARQIDMEVDIDVSKSETSLQELQKKIKETKSFVDTLSEAEVKSGFYAPQINQLNSLQNQYKTLNDKINQTKVIQKDISEETKVSTRNFQSLGDRISSAFDGAGTKAKRFVLALFSVRSVFMLISRASRTYLSQNESTSNAIAGAWEYLGNVLGPIIEKIVSWLRYGIAYLNVFLKALTKHDFLAKSIQKTTAKTNKELKKTVSSMDEIVNLDLDSGSGNGAGSALQDIQDLELDPKVVEFMEKLGEALRTVWDWAKTAWNFLEEHFGTAGAMAIVAGLALILGGKGSGLLGISGVLSGLATIGTIVIGVDLLYGALTGRDLIQDLKDIKKGFDDLKSIEKDLGNAGYNNADATNTITNAYKTLGDQLDITSNEDVEDFINKLDQANATAMDSVNSDFDIIKSEGYLSDAYKGTTASMEANINEMKSNKSVLENLKTKLENNRTNLDKNSQAYQDNEDRIKQVNKALKNLNNYGAKTQIYVEFYSNFDNFFGGLLTKLYKFTNNFSFWGSGWKSIFGYATGGFPNEGQMFYANEKGPELVGNIGNSTAVVNNNQIVESVSQGVAQAVSSVLSTGNKGNQTAQYLYINGSEFAKAIYNDMQIENQRRNTNASIRRA